MNIRFLTTLVCAFFILTGCNVTSLPTGSASLGTPITMTEMMKQIEAPGPIRFQKHLAATWQVPLSGLLNLNHPKAVAANLEDKAEDIEIYVYSLTHPTRGTYLVDSGLAQGFLEPADNKDLGLIVKLAMNTDALELRQSTASVRHEVGEISGVFLTHLHLDHIMGLKDLPREVPLYTGPGDAQSSSFQHLFTQGTTDRLLEKQESLNEWQFESGMIIDVFGDGSLFALHAPGHTPGTTAYLARTTNGPELMLGDVTHTRWGWENCVEPGTYSANPAQSAMSLKDIQTLANRISNLSVHPGHQSL